MRIKAGHNEAVRRIAPATLLAAALMLAALLAGDVLEAPAQSSPERVRVASTGFGAERHKTVPIARQPLGKPRSVISLPAGDIGRIESGDRVEGKAELEVSTTCLEPMRKCVGKIYRYSPFVLSRLVLAAGPKATKGVALSKWRKLRCSQKQPHRNHHCVIVIPGAQRVIDDVSKLPCGGQYCRLNLVVSAYHPTAKSGHRLVIGVDASGGISQNKGHVAAAVYSPATARSGGRQVVQRKRRLSKIGIGGSQHIVAARRLNRLRAGERLVVEAKMRGGIGHLSYASLVQSRLILARSPRTTKRKLAANIGSFRARFGRQNGFNCTQGYSAHRTPCLVRKVGTMRITRDARKRPLRRVGKRGKRVPLYVNLIVGANAVGVQDHRARSGDKMRIKGVSIKVRRYGG